MENAKPSSFTIAAAARFCFTELMPAIFSATSESASWMEIWMCYRPASRWRSARARVRPRPEVTSVL